MRVVSDSPRLMAPAAAAKVLILKLSDARRPRTVADASAETGLALRDAESGLTFLTAEYRGHLRVTEEGELLYVFPTGFTKPWVVTEWWQAALSRAVRALLGVGRFLVRAWLLVAMVTYALLFVAVLIGLSVASGDRRDSRGSGLSLVGVLLRAIADALFWTARPFSPVYMMPHDASWSEGYGARRARVAPREAEVPFYERVNRFVFGPKEPEPDPLAIRARVLAELRLKKGRIGLLDVMRVTGLSRAEADPLMARLMLDHEGNVEVSDAGGIYYTFSAMRKTAGEGPDRPQPPAWDAPRSLPPITGNGAGTNVGIALLNAFNLVGSLVVLGNGLTLSNLALLFSKKPPPVLPYDGTPIVLGVVPLVFSVMVFLLPVLRAATRPLRERAAKKENARLQIMKEVLTRAPKREEVSDETLRAAVRVATGREPTSKEITREVVALGGDVSPGPEGEIRYRFADLEAEAEALEEERERASPEEARVGRVVFASDR
jgi:hypothetical protein